MGTTATIVLALMCTFGSARVQAATYYVATTGNDANSGTTLAAPFRTIQKAANIVQAGDTVLIRKGTYTAFAFNRYLAGTSAAPIVFKNYPSETPVIDYYISNTAEDHTILFNKGASYVTLDGLEITNSNPLPVPDPIWCGSTGNKYADPNFHTGNGIKFYEPADHLTFKNLHIYRTSSGGIQGHGTDILIQGNRIHDGGRGGRVAAYATYVLGTRITIRNNICYKMVSEVIRAGNSPAQLRLIDSLIEKNTIYGNKSEHWWYDTANPDAGTCVIKKGGYGIVGWGSDNSVIRNNLIYGNETNGIRAHGTKNKVYNNTVYGNKGWGLGLSMSSVNGTPTSADNNFARNNIVYANDTGGTGHGDLYAIDSYGIFDYNLTTNPQMANPGGGDFRLTANSLSAINKGANLAPIVTDDIIGTPRPQGTAYDIGAYEYGASTPPPAFNFSLSNGGNKTVTQGGSVTNSLTATLVSGTAQAVSLSISGLPAGVTGSFSPASCTPNCSSTLTLSASASASAGSASVTVTATGGGISRTSAFTLTVNATTPPPPPPPGTGPVGWWKLDENTGLSAADGSGNGNNGTLTNGPVWTAGRMGSGLAFDGTNDSVTIPHSPSLALAGAFSMAAWVNPVASTTSFKSVMVKNSTHFLYASVRGYCGNGAVLVGFVGSAGTKTACDRNPLPANAWTHLAATNDGSVMRLYRNGVMTSSAAVTGVPITSTGTLQLGASRYGEHFNGKLDEARVYNRALSATEVLALFNAAPSGSVTDLNGDGITNVTDIQIAVNQAAGGAACGSGDVNRDGVCNVADVQLVVNRSLGL
jgi:parallel beta-helix repeat protein